MLRGFRIFVIAREALSGTVVFFRPVRGLSILRSLTACAVGYIPTPLRGCRIQTAALGREDSLDCDFLRTFCELRY